MELQPIATVIAALIGGSITAIVSLKLQEKKRNDELDLKSFDYKLAERLREFEQKLIGKNSYLTEKGKNAATKEDINELTRKVESIKSEHLRSIELWRWQLSKESMIHQQRVSKEFEVYTQIWETAFELNFSVKGLRPSLDYKDPKKPEIEIWQERYDLALKCRKKFFMEIERWRPFYPAHIYQQLLHLLRKLDEEILDFETSLRQNEGKMPASAYERSSKNIEEISKSSDEICSIIQKRLEETSELVLKLITQVNEKS